MHPPKTNGDVRKLIWQHKVKSTPKKRVPAIANSAVREKVTSGRAGIRWDNVVRRVWKVTAGKPRRDTAHGQVWGVKDSR